MRKLQETRNGKSPKEAKRDSLLCYKEDYSYSLFVTRFSYTFTEVKQLSYDR